MDEFYNNGELLIPDDPNARIYRKIYLDTYKGQVIQNIWTDIPIVNPMDKEHTEFSTQKPERLLERIVQSTTVPSDIVLDFQLGSGTTTAVAHKMGRRYIGVEQMDYIENITLKRLKKEIGKRVHKKESLFEELEYDEAGISKTVNWQGGGDFIYCELMKYNEAYMDKIQNAKSSEELVNLCKDIAENSFLNWYVNTEMPEEAVNDFIAIGKTENGLDKQKKLLAELLNKNQLYVNLSEIDDEDFNVSDEDKKLNQSFYGEDS